MPIVFGGEKGIEFYLTLPFFRPFGGGWIGIATLYLIASRCNFSISLLIPSFWSLSIPLISSLALFRLTPLSPLNKRDCGGGCLVIGIDCSIFLDFESTSSFSKNKTRRWTAARALGPPNEPERHQTCGPCARRTNHKASLILYRIKGDVWNVLFNELQRSQKRGDQKVRGNLTALGNFYERCSRRNVNV